MWGMDWIELAWDKDVAATYECGIEASGCINCGKFLDYLQAG
jgi:hypothetical protein